MSILKTVSLAIDQAAGKRDRVRSILQHVERSHHFAQEQMAQLDTYASETETKWMLTAQVNVSPELMRHHYQFMARLQHAIELQKSVVENSAEKVIDARQAALDAEVRLASLTQFLTTKEVSAQAEQVRREQKSTDEYASMKRHRGVFDELTEEDE